MSQNVPRLPILKFYRKHNEILQVLATSINEVDGCLNESVAAGIFDGKRTINKVFLVIV